MPPSRARRYMGQLVTSWPLSVTSPASGSIMPQVMRKEVVLPAPLGPSSPTISPGSTSKSTPSTTRRRPYDLTRPLASSSDMAGDGGEGRGVQRLFFYRGLGSTPRSFGGASTRCRQRGHSSPLFRLLRIAFLVLLTSQVRAACASLGTQAIGNVECRRRRFVTQPNVAV